MIFSEFLSKGWSDHGKTPDQVADSLQAGLRLATSPDDVIALVNLTAHLYTEHIPRFIEGERQLREFAKSDYVKGTPAEFAVARAVAAFRMCEGTLDPETDRMGLTPGDLARALGLAASALSGRDSVKSEKFLRLALSLVESLELTSTDGISRGLAIAANNSSATLMELETQTEQQKTFMLLTAEVARKYWELAGTWLEVERAEYYWALRCLKANDPQEARKHAELSLKICTENGSVPLEMFFASEAMARVERAAGSNAFHAAMEKAVDWFDKISPEDKTWAQASLDKLKN